MPPKKSCVFSRLLDWEVLNGPGVSESVLIAGVLNDKQVVVKVAFASTEEDNSLEMERNMYMFVAQKLQPKTPHLLAGMEVGACSAAILFSDQDAKTTWADIARQQPEMKEVLDELKAEESDEEEEEEDSEREEEEDEMSPEELLSLIESDDRLERLKMIYYVVTPRLKGVSLKDFLENPKNSSFYKDPNFAMDVSFQVAQALCVLDDSKIRHNDLHVENIYVQAQQKTESTEYKFPAKFVTESKFHVTIFDFDRTAFPSKYRNSGLASELCEEEGQCDSFVKNWDWYTFLTYFIGLLEHLRVKTTLLREVYGNDADIQVNNFAVSKGKDASLGKACICTELSTKISKDGRVSVQCAHCEVDVNRLELMRSPCEFFAQMTQKSIVVHM